MDFVSFRRALHIIHSGSVLDVEIIPGNNMNRLQYMDRATRECILLMLSPERHEPASPWVPKMAHPLCKHKSKQMLIKTCTWASEMRTCFLVNPRRPREHFEHVHVLSDGQLHARPRQKKTKGIDSGVGIVYLPTLRLPRAAKSGIPDMCFGTQSPPHVAWCWQGAYWTQDLYLSASDYLDMLNRPKVKYMWGAQHGKWVCKHVYSLHISSGFIINFDVRLLSFRQKQGCSQCQQQCRLCPCQRQRVMTFSHCSQRDFVPPDPI